jgi:ABC-type transport system substrate-binding protein/class 3 adenylate cyclase
MAVAGDQRIVSVLMGDIVGSTAIGERLGPERTKFLFDEVIALMGGEVRRFEGTVAQLTGDGILALFGAPVAHEDDAERSVRAALAIQTAIAAYARDVREAYGIDLAVRVAVNTGPVVVRGEPAPEGERYNALGDTVNVAARLQTIGDDGGVLVTATTARQIEPCFELESLGELHLRGREEVVEAFRVAGELDTSRSRTEVPLVGRDFDLAVLEHACESLADGSGVIVTVSGEPGIGKSRLVHELRARAGERVRFLEGRAVSYAESFPYWPVRDLLRDWLGLAQDAPEARVRLELKAALTALGADVERLYPFLANLLGLSAERDGASALRDLARDALRRETFAAVAELVELLAEPQPLCLILEDLHWADEASLDLVAELLDLTETTQVGLVLVLRDERDRPSWRLGERARQLFPHRYREIELRALAPDASRALAERLASGTLPDPVATLLAERAGGNPFFLGEALADLIERGSLLRGDDGTWELAAEPDALVVPTIVQAALQARLDRLSPATRSVVSVAAAAGRSFGLPLLERLLERDDVRRGLSELMRLDLVVEVRRRPAPEYRFRHGLVQEAAYASLLEPVRRELHLRIGEALEQVYGDACDEIPEVLARHFAEAEEPGRASRYLLAAGDAARAVYADREALEHYRRARVFLARIGDPVRERETLFKIALVRHLAFEFKHAEDAYDAAFTCRVPEPEPGPAPTASLDLVIASPGSFVPGASYSTQSGMIVEQLFRGLLRVDRDMNVVPDLAENMRVSSDGLQYLFMLRDGAFWSDGEPLTMDDFVYAWRRLREEGLVTAFLLDDVESATALDDWTLEVRLREPRNYFPYVLASHWAFPWPQHKAEALGEAWRSPENIVCNGPFVLEDVTDEGLHLRANPYWRGATGNVAEARVIFRDCAERDGGAGRPFDLEIGNDPALLELPGAIAQTSPMMGTWYVGFNAQRPPFDNERVRLAVAHAIDRRELLASRASLDHAAERGGAIPPIVPGHTADVAPGYDPERAAALLAEAGYGGGRGFGELRFLAAHSFESGNLAEQLARIGLRVSFEHRPTSEHGIDEREFQAWVGAWYADYPDPDGFYLGLLGTRALPFHHDRQTDALLAEARGSRNRDDRLRLYHEFERVWIGQRVAMVPLAYSRRLVLRRPHVHGSDPGPLSALRLDEIVVGDVEVGAAEADASASAAQS